MGIYYFICLKYFKHGVVVIDSRCTCEMAGSYENVRSPRKTCIYDPKKAIHTSEMMSVLCVAIFWVVNASRVVKEVVYSFRYRLGSG